MNKNLNMLFSLICLLLYNFISPSYSLPLCTDLRAPAIPKKPLAFCLYNGKVCCDSSKDAQLKKIFEGMNISDTACSSAVKSIICSTCDQFSAELFKVKSGPRPVPVLCNSTATSASFCSSVWDSCQNIPIANSPFAPSLQSKAGGTKNSNSSLLTDFWQSKTDFCQAFGGNSDKDSFCFNGEQVPLKKNETLQPPNGMCFEKIADGAYLNMVPHPDGSNRAFFSNQAGKIWVATIPDQDSGEAMELDESSPFADLTDQVYLDARFGMMGMAFHPNFAKNGRFFASFNCDKSKSPSCAGRCACNSDVGCDPSKINPEDNKQPCQYHTVVAEFSANGTAPSPSMAEKAKPSEVRRIFTMGLPFTANHGGQILFGPEDGYLYFMMGDGGSKGDSFNFAQNKKSLLGKIMRVDIDNIPSQEEISDLGHWGNYSVPRDNPYSQDKDLQPEIWALGLRDPWRCSFDSERPSYFICADVGQDHYEEVDIITKGGNYGWSMYEGPFRFKNASADDFVDSIFPVLGYSHSEVNKEVGSAAISGGYVYRSKTDPCIYGSYLYGDLYAKNFWAAQENPYNSGNFTTRGIPFSCAHDSPLNCSSVPNSPLPALGYIFSFGQDNRKDPYVLTSTGVYRVVRPSRCNYTCSKETARTAEGPGPSAPSDSHIAKADHCTVLVLYCLLLLTSFIL
ncbi:HIPL1 protein-like isoform X1 [Lycium ferocissimum]|uniref:HIPL1 protein-like isoform X1 n=2 Tax=Lycium ferocissimum TaxID=112874 RepID=UPI0028156B96|nr:HIPL1 protein-like isoform X1 [Lycium ferocissimum]